MKKMALLLLLLLMGMLPVSAQQPVSELVNNSLRFRVASGVKLPQPITTLFCLDNKLHVGAGDMLFVAAYSDGYAGSLEIDTTLLAIDPALDYAVRHPLNGSLFFTKDDGKGHSVLFERYEKRPGKYEVRRIKPSRFSFSIERPVFSADGKAMVFASDCPLGFGGKDLWYSEWRNDEWQYPQNMGRRINTVGDETMPAIYGEFLIFSSNGRSDGRGANDLYAARLVATEQTGDTVMMYPIGQCDAYSLEAPFCSGSDDILFAVNSDRSGGWWVMREGDEQETVYSFSDRLDCVMLSGMVSGVNGHTVANATVTVRHADVADRSVRTDSAGRYTLFLQPDEPYELVFSASEHFATTQQFTPIRLNEESLYNRNYLDASLFSFTLDSVYAYNDFFFGTAGCELSPAGRARLDVLARYLTENGHLKINILSDYRLSSDSAFCQLLNDARIHAVQAYLTGKGVPSDQMEPSPDLLALIRELHDELTDEADLERISRFIYVRFLR